MNAQGKEYFQGIGWVYYDLVLQEAYSDTDSKRKFYKLKRFAKASCKAKFGYERTEKTSVSAPMLVIVKSTTK